LPDKETPRAVSIIEARTSGTGLMGYRAAMLDDGAPPEIPTFSVENVSKSLRIAKAAHKGQSCLHNWRLICLRGNV
jgi:hypothetical protein